MRRLRPMRPTPSMVVACVALLVALGGTSYAAVVNVPRNSVGTLHLKNNAVNSIKVRDFSLLAEDFAPNQLPPTALWAVVWQNGAIHRSSTGVTSASRQDAGSFAVRFDRDVSRCAYTATLGNPTARGRWFGFVTVAVDPAAPNAVEVGIYNTASTYTDMPFYLAVVC